MHVAGSRPTRPSRGPIEHAALRWLGAADLDTVDWIDADRAVLADLVELLRRLHL